MRVRDEFIDCVVFLGAKSLGATGESQQTWFGTGFFIGVPIESSPDDLMPYLITADHVIQKIQEVAVDDMVIIRANHKVDGAVEVRVPIDQWLRHGDWSVDVAVLRGAPAGDFAVKLVPLAAATRGKGDGDLGVGIGDEVFVAGLFVAHLGEKRNLPIVRIGNIAAMPGDPVKSRRGNMVAYLIEARSTGGLSGSPVFVNMGHSRADGSKILQAKDPRATIGLLGIVHGHWDAQVEHASDDAITVADDEKFNMGIAIVIPIERATEMILESDEVKKRAEIFKEHSERPSS